MPNRIGQVGGGLHYNRRIDRPENGETELVALDPKSIAFTGREIRFKGSESAGVLPKKTQKKAGLENRPVVLKANSTAITPLSSCAESAGCLRLTVATWTRPQ